jgi:hypothetical protein
MEPGDAFIARDGVVHEPRSHGEADQLVPSAWFPNHFDIRAAGLGAMVQPESGFGTAQIPADEIIAMPVGRIIHLERKMSERAPVAPEDFTDVRTKALQQFRRSLGTIAEFRESGWLK